MELVGVIRDLKESNVSSIHVLMNAIIMVNVFKGLVNAIQVTQEIFVNKESLKMV
jgi:hypothetical protein